MDMGFTYYIYPRRELFSSFEELDGGLMSMRDGHSFLLVEGIVHIKMYDETLRELKEMRYIPSTTEYNLSWNFGSGGPQRDSWRRCSQDV